MALQDVGVRAVIEGLASFQSGMRSMQAGVNKFSADVGAAGRSMALLGAPLVAIGVVGVKAFADFERTMTRVQAVSGATEDEFLSLEKVAREMGRTTIFSATESAEALAFMSQAGLSAADQIEALPKVLELAAAGMLDIAQAADIVTNVMAGAQLGVEDLGRANDVLTVAFTSANTNLQQLATAFKFAGPVASAAGVSFEETSAALALMGNAGLQASIAGTGLRGAITRLLNPTSEAAEVIERLGVEVTDTQGRLLPLSVLVAQFEQAGLSAADAMTIFGQRAGPALLTLVSQGSDALITLRDQMLDSSGTASGIAAKQMDTFTGQMAELRAAIESVSIEIGKVLVPILGDIIDAVRPVIEDISNFAEANPKLTVTVIALGVAVAALGVVLIGVGAVLPGLVASLGLFTGALGLATGAVTALAAATIGLEVVMVETTLVVAAFGVVLAAPIAVIALVIASIAALTASILIFRDAWANVFQIVGNIIERFVNSVFLPAINLIVEGLNLIPGVSIPLIKELDLELGGAFLSLASKADDAVSKIKGLIPSLSGVSDVTKALVPEIAKVEKSIDSLSVSLDPKLPDALAATRIAFGRLQSGIDEFAETGVVGVDSLTIAVRSMAESMRRAGSDGAALRDDINVLSVGILESEGAYLNHISANRVLAQAYRDAASVSQALNDQLAKLPSNLNNFTTAQLATEQAALLARSAIEAERAAMKGLGEEIDTLAQKGQRLQAQSLGAIPFVSPQGILESLLASGVSREAALRIAALLEGAGIPGRIGTNPTEFRDTVSGLSNIINTVPSDADRSSSVDSHDTTINVDAHYTTPQEPRGIRSDLETVAQMMR